MQTMSWMMSRLGSRFSLFFEPHHRRVMHGGLGRFVDEPVDLMVGLEEPDGTRRVLPLSQRAQLLYNSEQFERTNSLTFRGYSEHWRLRFEFNVHSVFYPNEEQMCVMPAFYLEMRVNPVDRVGRFEAAGPCPEQVTVFLNLQRPNTDIAVSCEQGGQVDLSYDVTLKANTPAAEMQEADRGSTSELRTVSVTDRIVSLNPECEVAAPFGTPQASDRTGWHDEPHERRGSEDQARLRFAIDAAGEAGELTLRYFRRGRARRRGQGRRLGGHHRRP